jgi:hypothetical protein
MSWLITPTFSFDADAQTYITAVETADGQALETATRYAINNFVIGCKQDGIWSAIKASCILAGARTLSGALVPLVGTAPTNFNFVSGDYNRKTGLVGDKSTKYLDSNRNNNADPQNSSPPRLLLHRRKPQPRPPRRPRHHAGECHRRRDPLSTVVAVSNHRTRGHGPMSRGCGTMASFNPLHHGTLPSGHLESIPRRAPHFVVALQHHD